ncbi:MAG: tyrosine/phenylalanine carboxypeptidase domain-containing protein, partial [Pseudomonadota bacterium]
MDAAAPSALRRCAALDKRLVKAVRDIRVLDTVAWPVSVERRFLEDLHRGRETLPRFEYRAPDFSTQRAELDAIASKADASHPLGAYLQRSAASWQTAARMLEAVGTDGVTAPSIELYGRPGDALPGGTQTNLDAARWFLDIAEEMGNGEALPEAEYCIPAEVLRSKVAVFADFHRRLATTRRMAGERERMLRAEAARAEAERASAAKDHFLAMLSHELRTPLSPVLNTLELMMDTSSGQAPELRAQLETIRRNVVLEARLIDDLLDLTKVSRGKVSLRLEAVDVQEAIQNVLHICEAEMQEKHITVNVSKLELQAMVRADSARLKQILWNLIRNAVKYSSPHGKIDIALAREKRGHICIHVTDTGCGISPELLPNIFEAFRQGMHTTGGLGLGLAITRSLVELHGGNIEAYSEGLGCGATFSVCLPAAAPDTLPSPAASRKDQPAAPTDAPRRTGRILLVEDHTDSRETLERILRHRGYTVETASSVATALELTHKAPFDVV